MFRRHNFLEGTKVGTGTLPDSWWFRSDGLKMTARDWDDGALVLGLFLNGDAIPARGPHGEPVTDDTFVLLFNASGEEVEFMLPRQRMGRRWILELSTADPQAAPGSAEHAAHTSVHLPPRSTVVLRRAT